MSAPTVAALVVFAGVALIQLPSIVDRARRNKQARQARARRLAQVDNFWASSEVTEAWAEESTPENDRLVCEQIARAEGWAS